MIEQQIINWMILQRENNGMVLLSTRDIANATNMTIYQARGHLENLLRVGVIGRTPEARGTPVLWFLI
ncbi:FaeA/PapI family transcriptional regulator [Escherichia coli]|uniref:FaeA/PapI family transcriptional regulator n=1 Tax=Escherichia coli TaxID=562 RepID=UPI0030F3F651